MLKITIFVLLGLIIYFFLKARNKMLKIDARYKTDRLTEIRKIQLQIQKKLEENKRINKR